MKSNFDEVICYKVLREEDVTNETKGRVSLPWLARLMELSEGGARKVGASHDVQATEEGKRKSLKQSWGMGPQEPLREQLQNTRAHIYICREALKKKV